MGVYDCRRVKSTTVPQQLEEAGHLGLSPFATNAIRQFNGCRPHTNTELRQFDPASYHSLNIMSYIASFHVVPQHIHSAAEQLMPHRCATLFAPAQRYWTRAQ